MALLREPRRRRHALISFGALLFALLPNSIGFQDLGALLAHQPGVAARAHSFVLASPFGTIHAATFSLPSPLGTAIPHPPIYALANFDPDDIASSIASQFLGDPNAPLQFPKVNRKDKRDSALARAREPMPPLPPLLTIDPIPASDADATLQSDETSGRFDPYSDYQFASVADEPAPPAASLSADKPAGDGGSRVYFSADPLDAAQPPLTPFAEDEKPVVLVSRGSGDPDIKLSALAPQPGSDQAGESFADKGEVTGAEQRPKSPAERLALAGAPREKAEKCLANAVYFEARGESVRGQIAVAQVVLNRVFSGFYPHNVCEVVYQNANRRFGCQFTFACDGVPDVVTEPDAYARAKRIARDMLDGKLWMPEVAKATHYHAFWVHPDWVNEMKKIAKLGVHTFYRPRNWGDGSDQPTWGDAKLTAQEAAQEELVSPVSHSREWLRSEEGRAAAAQSAK